MQIERTRFFVEGVRAPITACVAGRRSDGIVLTQALPFLRLDTAVTGEDGRRARIARVALAMDGDVPLLRLELAHERKRLDDTEPRFTPGVTMRRARTDTTVPYDYRRIERKSVVVVGDRAPTPSWWSRLVARMTWIWCALTRSLALPRSS